MAANLDVRNLKVRSLDLDIFEISWEVADTTLDMLDYTFQVLRSESPSGPFTELSVPFSDRYLFVDNALYIGDRWRLLHYVIRTTHVPSGKVQDFGPVAHEPEPDLIALELRRHMQLLFHEFSGRRCWVLPVRTFGQRCPACWDNRLYKRIKSQCVTCFDTGFARGYMSPIETWVQFEPSPKSEQTTNVSAMQQSNTTARLGYYPPLKPRDVIVEPENRRWRVNTISATEQVRAPVHQEITVHELAQRDIEFEIPIVLDEVLKDVFFSPPRNFSNPQNTSEITDAEWNAVLNLFAMGPAR